MKKGRKRRERGGGKEKREGQRAGRKEGTKNRLEEKAGALFCIISVMLWMAMPHRF